MLVMLSNLVSHPNEGASSSDHKINREVLSFQLRRGTSLFRPYTAPSHDGGADLTNSSYHHGDMPSYLQWVDEEVF